MKSLASDLSWTQHIQSITSEAMRLLGLLFQQFCRLKHT